jgi:hypothetical protein
MIYLAQPYSHVNARVRAERFKMGLSVVAQLMAKGKCVVSPIAHSHPIYDAHPEVGGSFEQWQELDETLILASEAVYVLTLEGWEESHGVAKEMEFALARGIEVVFIDEFCDKVLVQMPPAGTEHGIGMIKFCNDFFKGVNW